MVGCWVVLELLTILSCFVIRSLTGNTAFSVMFHCINLVDCIIWIWLLVPFLVMCDFIFPSLCLVKLCLSERKWLKAGLRSSWKNEVAPELSVFVSMTPAPELCFFKHGSGFALLIQFNKFNFPSVRVASERVIPTYFELTLLPLPGLVSRKEFGLE